MEIIKLNQTDLAPDTKCKLYVQFGLIRNVSSGHKTELHKGVKLKNIPTILSKCNQENIKKVIIKTIKPIDGNKDNAYVLYSAPELL